MSDPRFDTLALHAGAAPDPVTGARATPIYQTTSFSFRDTDHAAALFNMERAGHVYSRISNPTVAVFEERVAALEGGAGAIGTASGQAALHLAIATLMGAGAHIVASAALYGGSHNLLDYTLRRFGIETTFVKPGDLDAWRAALRPNTRLLFGETLGNPGLDVLDIAAVAQIAHDHRVPLLVDSTFTTPYLLRPFDHGADFVYHSATKFLGGHGTTIGGVLVDGGTFDFEASGRFPEFTEPYAGFHGMVFSEESSVAPLLLRARREGLRDFGACLHPQAAWQLLQGIETLPLRMERHVANARRVVEFLDSHDAVETVAYPELPDHPDHALARRLLPRGAGAVFSFDLAGGRDAGKRFIESLALFSHLANVGDARSLVIHPASTTHFRMDEAALAAAGIGAGTIRLSIGLEDPDDLIDDLKRALKISQKAPAKTGAAARKEVS
ncbi:O-acetylhomoserine aminocarboxypropyltransferase [Paraburkholderia tropica]|uniref:O-acetylhomoserine aminocarboxypropyltransferase n=1 Tax=Paraburkholderia tropica TaxID=92647 RepID=UPI0007EE19A6|nr:O-acetylhomoserine aminocarboxypropyltransferase [Paraburkholderia tropica]MBB2984712.1 O-acetylhomoserine (thiol)-lyase [Paraburkholderia tropica]OBR46482.1 O-acetylhomoserine aminocarboxypropyltransferase [Paraburkholderia tropica]QNB11050.1 O-acetylhomoserine aminocarboxypropyltransferase [Paraburkholderia tropica]